MYTTAAHAEKPYKAWYTADEKDVHSHMIRMIKSIQELQKERRTDDVRHAFLYQNRQPNDVMFGAAAGMMPDRFHVTYNVIKSCIDTLTSKITSNRPRPRVLTEKGDYDKQTRAQRLTQYLDGVFSSSGAYERGPDIFRDGGVFGTGVGKVVADRDEGTLRIERVLISEILVDDLEAAYGNPKNMYQTRLVSRANLLEEYPDHTAAIMRCAPVSLSPTKSRANVTDMIQIYEGWHLGCEEEHGRHVIAIEEACLQVEEWKFRRFPFAFYRYNTNIASFYGQGIAEELLGTQLEINKLLRDIQRAMHLIAVPRVLLEQNSKVSLAHLTNGIGSVMKYQGTRPDFFTPTAMNNEVYNHVQWLIASAFEKVGVSALSVSGKKPSGLDAAVALREYRDAESERFSATDMRYRQFFNDLAGIVIEQSRDMFENNPELSVTVESRKFIETIKWSEVDMEDDKFVSRVYSSSIFPTTPAAKLQKIEEYVRQGWIDKTEGVRLMDFPDVDAWETLETADRDYVSFILASILGKGKYIPPEPEMMLDKDINIVRKAYLEALKDGAESDKLELLLRWIEAAATMLPTPPPQGISPDGLPTQFAPIAPTQVLPG
jgi:hypothetical protein